MRSNDKKATQRKPVFLSALSVLLIFTALPVYGIAGSDDSTAPAQDPVVPFEDIFIIAEDATKRSEFEKHYYCSDGSFVAVTYPEAVHYQDDDGNWVNVDNRPTINHTEKTYEMVNGDFKVAFPDYAQASNQTNSAAANVTPPQERLVSMETGNYTLSWSLTAHKPVSVPGSMTSTSEASLQPLSVSPASELYAISDVKTVPETETTAFEEQVNIKDKTVFELPRASGKVAVSNIFGADEPVSVEYTVYRNKIEEDIYIHAPTDIEAYSMVVNCGDLTPQLNDDNSVDFLDGNGEMIYHVSIPYMVDAAYEATQNIEVSLLHKGSQCVISYTPDREWLNDEARVYPVLLDPAVVTNQYTAAIYDTYIEENSTANHSSEQALYINKNGANRRKSLIFIHKLPGIDPSVPITSATLTLIPGGFVYTDIPVKLESFDSTLLIDNVSYSLLQSYSRTTVATDTLKSYSSADPLHWDARQLCFDLTDHVPTMYQQLSSTLACRFALSFQNENSTLLFPSIHSAEATDASLRPYLTITYGYTIPDELKNDCIITAYNGSDIGYLYPHSGLSGDNNNILHYSDVAADSPSIQYILSRNPATGGYTMTYANAVASGAKITADTGTKRVYLHSEDDPSKQEWLIVPHIFGYRIVLRSDMQYALTAVGSSSGYNDDLTITTDGHVILKKFTGTLEFNMMWVIDKRHDYWGDVFARGFHVTGSQFTVTFTVRETGEYDIETFSNRYTGDHGTNIYLYNHFGTLLSGATNLNNTLSNVVDYNSNNIAFDRVDRASIISITLTAGTVYKLSVTQYSETTDLDCYLILSHCDFSIDSSYYICHDFTAVDVDPSLISTDSEDVIGALSPLESFDCRDYAVVAYYNHYYNTQYKYNDISIGYITQGIKYGGTNNVDNSINSFVEKGYIAIDHYVPTCIIIYTKAHFSVSINGVISSKDGGSGIRIHNSYDGYFNGREPLGFVILPDTN